MKVFSTLVAALAATLILVLPAGAARQAQSSKTVTVVAGKPSEFGYIFSTKTVPLGTVTFKLTDKGTLPHDLEICASNKGGNANACKGKDSATISPGGATSVTVTFAKTGTYEYLCTLPGHAAAGMKGDLKVT